MNGLLDITQINLPFRCIEEFYKHLRTVGRKKLEGVALLAGTPNGSVFSISATIVPAQTSYNLESGLLYSVTGEELFRINKWLYENRLTMISQVHSHPGEAYHSEMDDAYPIVTMVGGLSIVIPDFGFGEFNLGDWAVYRLSPENEWVYVEQREVEKLIIITN